MSAAPFTRRAMPTTGDGPSTVWIVLKTILQEDTHRFVHAVYRDKQEALRDAKQLMVELAGDEAAWPERRPNKGDPTGKRLWVRKTMSVTLQPETVK